MNRLACLVLALCAWTSTSSARAQEDPRALFERGTQAVEEGRFAEAEPDLERSLSIAPRPATAFNLIVALDGSGRLVRASEVCGRLVEGAYGEISPEQRAEAERTCLALRERVAHLVVRVRGAVPLEIRVDGRPVGQVGAGARLETELDPGWHHVSATSPGRPAIERSVSLDPGARFELELEPPAPGAAVLDGATSHATSGPDPGLVLGLTLGAAALVGGAITLGVVLTAGGPEPVPGDFRVVMTLVAR